MNLEEKKKIVGYNLKLNKKEAKALQHVLKEVIESDDIRKECPKDEIVIIEEINSLLYNHIVD